MDNTPSSHRFLQHTISIIKDKKSHKHQESLLKNSQHQQPSGPFIDHLPSSKNLQSTSTSKHIIRSSSPEPPKTDPTPVTTTERNLASGDCPILQNTSKSLNQTQYPPSSSYYTERKSYEKAVSNEISDRSYSTNSVFLNNHLSNYYPSGTANTASTCSTPTITTYSASSLSSLTTTTATTSATASMVHSGSRNISNPNAQIYGKLQKTCINGKTTSE